MTLFFWRMPGLLAVLGALVLLSSCGHREPLPPAHGELPPSPESSSGGSEGGEGGSVNQPERQALSELHQRCDRAIANLEEGYESEVRTEELLTAAAALTAVIGAGAAGRGGEPMPSSAAGEGGPIDQHVDETFREARQQIRAVNRGLEAVDEFVWARPDPTLWTAAERERWEALTRQLSDACSR